MNHLRTLELEKYAVKVVTVARATVKVVLLSLFKNRNE
jgi:hypothetical protein